jgi:hypothetical protein
MRGGGTRAAILHTSSTGDITRQFKALEGGARHLARPLLLSGLASQRGMARQMRTDGPDPQDLFRRHTTEDGGGVAGPRKNAEQLRTREGALIGTPAYM